MRKISGKIAIVADDEAVAPVLPQLLADDGPDPPPARCSSPARLVVLVDQLEVDVLERVVRLADRQHVGAGRHQRPGDGWCGDGRRRTRPGRTRPGRPGASRRRPAGRQRRRPGSGSGARVLTVSVLANSCSRSSSGRPIVRKVVFRIATRSQSRSASSRRWVVRKIVDPRWRSSSINSWTSRAATGSRPAVGSSRNSTSGSLSSALARATRWRRPFGQRAAGIVGPVGQVDRPQRAVDAIASGRAPRRGRRSIRGSRPRSAAGTGPATRA